MKKLFPKAVIALISIITSFGSCSKQQEAMTGPVEDLRPVYSTQPGFYQGLVTVVDKISQQNIIAYLDTMPNGFPNRAGRKTPLAQFGYSILQKLQANQVNSAVYDVFHFDGATFSLVSYLMKAEMAGDISAQALVDILVQIPLPPIPVDGFSPPVEQVAKATVVTDCCDNCNPKVKILVTWSFKAPCGNYEKKTSGYAANNVLNHMSSGKMYRFDAELSGCPCAGGVWTVSVDAPSGASYGVGQNASGNSATLLPVSAGTYTVTFTYKICNKTVTEKFTLTVD